MKTAVIYFGNDLDPAEFDKDERRDQLLEQGIRSISEVEGLQILHRLPTFCAVAVQGSESVIDQIRSLVGKTFIGRLTVNDPARPMFRAAR